MKKLRPSALIFIVLLLFFIGSMGLFFPLFTLYHQTENNTVSYTATVESVEYKQAENHTALLIHTQEYTNALMLHTSVEKQMDLEGISQLQKGENITFRIEKEYAEGMNNAEIMMIVALKTDNKEFLTLEQFNQYIEPYTYPAKIVGFVLSISLLIGCSICLYFVMKGRK